jgi:hypothetical protein
MHACVVCCSPTEDGAAPLRSHQQPVARTADKAPHSSGALPATRHRWTRWVRAAIDGLEMENPAEAGLIYFVPGTSEA